MKHKTKCSCKEKKDIKKKNNNNKIKVYKMNNYSKQKIE